MSRSIEILNELEEISPVVAAIGNENIFMVPEGYFDVVPGTVLISVKNEVVAGGEVPGGYFDALSTGILSKIEGTAAYELQQLSPLVAGIRKVNPFQVPENYFEQAGDEMTTLVMEEKIPPVLENISRDQPFDIPGGYFEQLPGTILNKAKAQSGARVIEMPKIIKAIWKYAAAAVFTGVIALGVYKYTSTTPAGNIPAALTETKFNETLESLPEEAIIKYLEKHGTQEDLAALASGIEEADLPDQEEYFTDEATLNKFLEDIELKN